MCVIQTVVGRRSEVREKGVVGVWVLNGIAGRASILYNADRERGREDRYRDGNQLCLGTQTPPTPNCILATFDNSIHDPQ